MRQLFRVVEKFSILIKAAVKGDTYICQSSSHCTHKIVHLFMYIIAQVD